MMKITQKIFIRYMELNHPEKMKFKPKLISVNGNKVTFGMAKHYGILTLTIPFEKTY